MQYSESVLTDLYLWCFSVPADIITDGSASSADGLHVVTIHQSEIPDTSLVWCVGAQSESYNITSFEINLSSCIDMFKQAWTDKDNPV